MSTLAQMRSRISDKLLRSDLNSQIDESINAAIEFYEAYRFWFSEKTSTFTTVAGQKSYGSADSVPTDIREIDLVRVTVSGTYYYPTRKTYQYIEEIDTTGFRGYPDFYAYYQEKFYFYPIPNAAWTVTVSYQQSYTELSADADTNDFTTYARKLIECHALALINSEILNDVQQASIYQQKVAIELQNLVTRTEKLISSNSLISTSF